jgi:adenosine deaminase
MTPGLPLVDLHRHLDGNVRLATILDLGARHGVNLPADDIETLRPHVQVMGHMPDLPSWLAKLHWMTAVLADLDACRRIARENVEDAAREGLHYIELRFSPAFMARPHGLDPREVVQAVAAGIADGAAATGIKVNLIGILSRTYGREACAVELEALLAGRRHLVAVDLAGDEKLWPAHHFIRHFACAREEGLAVTIHAGEGDGVASVWSALRDLGATRIGHGVRAIDDPALLDHLRERRIGLELNITSNVQTNTVATYAAHPLREFLDLGLLATINTDDPVISGIDLSHEFRVAAPAARLTPAHIAQAQRNAVEIAFLSGAEKAELLALSQVQKTSGGFEDRV